jgi:hypothetical protein
VSRKPVKSKIHWPKPVYGEKWDQSMSNHSPLHPESGLPFDELSPEALKDPRIRQRMLTLIMLWSSR